ncbi:MAG: FAA hydrolase family protein [Candidatus Heimdallarchaeota archaeon]|nr:FAA hydrolase family protein [Candidatus Heimdallarchaeota archaeon]
MIVLNFALEDKQTRMGALWNDKDVVDLKEAAEKIDLHAFEKIEKMEELIALGNEGIAKVQQIVEELKGFKKNKPAKFDQIKEKDIHSLEEIKFLAPVYNPQKIICLGRNYVEHAKEGGKEPPKNPMIWGKFNSAIIGHQEQILLPKISDKVDVEVELVVVIGKKGKNIPEEEALDHVFGYTIGNDVSARDYQYLDKQYTRAKTMDTFCPIGPWIVTKEEIDDPQKLHLELKVNDKTWQKSNTKHMSFSVAYIISYLSKSFTFEPGDLIFTGTPSGVGHYQDPPVYLEEGDTVKLTIEKIGTLINPVGKE